jgi:hypothetical protein
MITQADQHVWVDPQCIFEALVMYDTWKEEREKEQRQAQLQAELEWQKIRLEGGLR